MKDLPSEPAGHLIEMRGIRKSYATGSGSVEVLRDIDLTIGPGEFVAIMGASGSGKSTLMNLIGLLDRPSAGTYRLAGLDAGSLNRSKLARLRRDSIGFVFQRYNLIAASSATENVELPATYAGSSSAVRRERAAALLSRLGLGDRLNHRPDQLSGGQQQRVAIARALTNGAQLILADEPTGALDSKSGAEVIALLASLAGEGRTVVLVTHDRGIAQSADRIIEVADGRIIVDSGPPNASKAVARPEPQRRDASLLADIAEACKAAARALSVNVLRTALTLTGIIVGVAAVIALLGIGEGSRQTILDQLSTFGTNRLYVSPGTDSARTTAVGALTVHDADLIRSVPNVAAAMPYLHREVTVRYGNSDMRTDVTAVTTDYPRILDWPVVSGAFFTSADERSLATVAVIGEGVRRGLFPDDPAPLRKIILINNVPFQVIGVLAEKGAISGDADDDNTIAVPFATGSQRIFGTSHLSWISVLIDDFNKAAQTAEDITAVVEAQHHIRDFRIFNRAAAIASQQEALDSLRLLLASAAVISLLVGGIGIMNIMLMSVTERTREIGIRMAVGARAADIQRQFLSEAVMLSAAGGLAGLILGHLTGVIASLAGTRVIFTLHAAAAALGCGVLTGLIFGFMPAYRAARLEPVVALARD